MLTAYTEAVSKLRHTPYPDRGFWSVPVLYSQSNVIPFPRMPQIADDPYQDHLEFVDRSLSQIYRMLPQPMWSPCEWETRTRRFRMVMCPRLRESLEELEGSIIPAARASWGWAHDLTGTIRSILAALDRLSEAATPPSAGAGAVAAFHEVRQDFIDHAESFRCTLRALRERQ
jgi:hypothetical protein